MAKDGIGTILTFVLFSLVIFFGVMVTNHIFLKILLLISWIWILFTIYFFRDPERKTPDDEKVIVSPADGKIVSIEEFDENIFFKGRVQKISIFMSVFNVHVNRIPIDGKVTFFDYQRGKFYAAYKDEASHENEQTTIGIENNEFKILFKQIAGIMARRIVCHIREGHSVKRGERFGMIKFGSRVEVFLPVNVQINVKLNEKVIGGLTILGTY